MGYFSAVVVAGLLSAFAVPGESILCYECNYTPYSFGSGSQSGCKDPVRSTSTITQVECAGKCWSKMMYQGSTSSYLSIYLVQRGCWADTKTPACPNGTLTTSTIYKTEQLCYTAALENKREYPTEFQRCISCTGVNKDTNCGDMHFNENTKLPKIENSFDYCKGTCEKQSLEVNILGVKGTTTTRSCAVTCSEGKTSLLGTKVDTKCCTGKDCNAAPGSHVISSLALILPFAAVLLL